MKYLTTAAGGSLEGVNSVTALGKWSQLERFLILGDENGIYYAAARKLTPESAASVRELVTVLGV